VLRSLEFRVAAIAWFWAAVLPADAQRPQPEERGSGPWIAAALGYGAVAVGPRSAPSGVTSEVAGGFALSPRWRLGARMIHWSAFTWDGPAWRARTISAFVGYRGPSVVAFTAGLGVARVWDASNPPSARAWVAETGVELAVPRASTVGLRLYMLHDWAFAKSDVRGSLPFGSLAQFHVGLLGVILH
jgi:hypothetical protein